MKTAEALSVAGRLFTFNEHSEENLAKGMRDLDEVLMNAQRMYPDNGWSRTDLLLFFFLDSLSDDVARIRAAVEGTE